MSLEIPTPVKELGVDAGARYFRCDLQVHTPRDARWPGKEPTDPAERRVMAVEYLRASRDRGIEVVGITEHHDVSWIDQLRVAGREVGVIVMPGFEVETVDGVHVLCLFDPATKVVDLEDTLTVLGFDRAKRQAHKLTQIRSGLRLPELLRAVQDERGGVCVAAHVTSRKGLLTLEKGGPRADAWREEALLAVDVNVAPAAHPSEGTRRILLNEDPTYRRDRPVACIHTSDARGPAEIGSSSTWIKMATPSVAGLRQAFLDPDSRIALEDPSAGRTSAVVLSIAWTGGYFDGTKVLLSPELSCLIGGKGTGKSTIIESLRWAFGLSRSPADGEDPSDLLKSTLPAGTKVTVEFRTAGPDPKRLTVERTAPHDPVVRDLSGAPLLGVAPVALLRPRVYGQKQVFDVAQRATARLSLLDAFADTSLQQVGEREQRLLGELEEHAQVAGRLRRQAAEAESQLAELPSLVEWRSRFRAAGFEDRLRDQRVMQRERDLLDRADAALRERLRQVDELQLQATSRVSLSHPDFETSPSADLLRSGQSALRRADAAWEAGVNAVRDSVARAREELASVRADFDARGVARQADFDRALRALQKAAPGTDPERYLDVERRIERLEPLGAVREDLMARLADVTTRREAGLIALQDVRAERYRLRLAAAERLEAATEAAVRIEVRHRADRSAFLEELRSIKSGVRADALSRLAEREDLSPARFARAARAGRLNEEFELPEGQAVALERALDEAALERLETLELTDAMTISLDVGEEGRPDHRPLERLSPGQKSTAILLLILQASTDPLVIDQPEDDLDNRFIYDDVVRRLRAAKRRRQVILATHNANIPVLGDAEQILVLEQRAGARRGEIVAHGPIDVDDVRHAAEHILEGGEEAFRRRREKYGW